MNDSENIGLLGKLMRLNRARAAEWLTYRHWEDWRDAKDVGTRKLALKAKCYGIVSFDRVLRRLSKW